MEYAHLSQRERDLIQHFFNEENLSISEIAKKINRNKSTISRDLKRNTSDYFYDAEAAHKKALSRHRNKYFFHNLKYEEFSKLFLRYYDKRYHGVNATYHKIQVEHPNITMPSVRQVFNLINNWKWVIKPCDRLRHFRKNGPKRTVGIFSKFKDKWVLPIWIRPKSVDLRQEYGDYEVDLIIGRKSTGYDNLLTFNERKSRKLFIKRVKSKNPMKINSIIKSIIDENHLHVNSITVDNGIEFQKIGLLAYWVKCKVYFCEPYASYQRGSNENLNGLVRRMYKKKTNFNEITDEDIYNLQEKINNMPRQMFNWKSSNQIFDEIKK